MSQNRKQFLYAAFVIMVYVTAAFSIFCGAYMVAQLPGQIDTLIFSVLDQSVAGYIAGMIAAAIAYVLLFGTYALAWHELFTWQQKLMAIRHAA